MGLNRRRLLGTALSTAALGPISVDVRASTVRGSSSRRRPRPGDAAWPDASAWARLAHSVDQRLVAIHSPLTAACADPAPGACERLFAALKNPFFVGDQPGLTQTLGWVGAWTSRAERLRGTRPRDHAGRRRSRQLRPRDTICRIWWSRAAATATRERVERRRLAARLDPPHECDRHRPRHVCRRGLRRRRRPPQPAVSIERGRICGDSAYNAVTTQGRALRARAAAA